MAQRTPKPTPAEPEPTKRPASPGLSARTLRNTLIALLIGIVLAVVIFPLSLGFVRAWNLLHPGCGSSGMLPKDQSVPYRATTFTMRDGTRLPGLFFPGSLPGLIISPPTYGAARDALLDELLPLAAQGYALLKWDSRACVGQPVSLGLNEARDVADVLAYIRANPADFPLASGTKIALHGFSAGGATVLLAAASLPDISAVVTEGNFGNWDEVTGLSYGSGYLEAMFGVGGHLAYRLTTGADVAALSPIDAVPAIVPRPIYFIYGELEAALPSARRMLAQAQRLAPDQEGARRYGLWVIPGADHGFYTLVAKEAYQEHLRPFYDCKLLGDASACAAWEGLTTR